MNRFVGSPLRAMITAAVLSIAVIAIPGCESKEVGSIKPPEVKDRSELLPGHVPNAKSPYSAGAVAKKTPRAKTNIDANNPVLTDPRQ